MLTQQAIIKYYNELKNLSPKDLVEQRMNKYAKMGVYND
jgi:acetyl-CoA carboxylase carboxyl transferase subunit alpha